MELEEEVQYVGKPALFSHRAPPIKGHGVKAGLL